VNKELERAWRDAILTSMQVLSQTLPDVTEEIYNEYQVGQLVSLHRFEH
jgi:hypothetical protein